jgi:hypothetical protein
MKQVYGGVAIETGHVVAFFELWTARPVFHRWTEGLDRVPASGCGRPLFERGTLASATLLPPKHAIRFARPCRVCWPELARSTQLELELKAGRL